MSIGSKESNPKEGQATEVEIEKLIAALVSANRPDAEQLIKKSIQDSSIHHMIENLLTPTLERLGNEWVHDRRSLFEIYMSTRICDELIHRLSAQTPQKVSHEFARQVNPPKIAIAALLDFHLLGKKLVQLTLHSAGYNVLDYGQGISVEEVVKRVQNDHIEILLISTLMLPSALKVKELRRALNQAGCRVKIIVGGAPFRFDAHLWREVEADAMGTTASDALRIINELLEENPRAA